MIEEDRKNCGVNRKSRNQKGRLRSSRLCTQGSLLTYITGKHLKSKSSQGNGQLHKGTSSLHRWHENTGDRQPIQTERRRSRGSSFFLFLFLTALMPSFLLLLFKSPDSTGVGSRSIPSLQEPWTRSWLAAHRGKKTDYKNLSNCWCHEIERLTLNRCFLA